MNATTVTNVLSLLFILLALYFGLLAVFSPAGPRRTFVNTIVAVVCGAIAFWLYMENSVFYKYSTPDTTNQSNFVPLYKDGATCAADADCESRYCDKESDTYRPHCITRPFPILKDGAACSTSAQCHSGWCSRDTDSIKHCTPTTH